MRRNCCLCSAAELCRQCDVRIEAHKSKKPWCTIRRGEENLNEINMFTSKEASFQLFFVLILLLQHLGYCLENRGKRRLVQAAARASIAMRLRFYK
jgi:hypothetical protein